MARLLVEMISGRTNVRHSACGLVFLVKPWDALDESTSPGSGVEQQPGPVTIRGGFRGALQGYGMGAKLEEMGV
jgi:hypothetical protein